MKPIPIFLVLLVLVGLSCGRVTQVTSQPPVPTLPPATEVPASPLPPPPVPTEFQPLADELNAGMGSFEASLGPPASKSQVILATELAFANGNLGEGLLNPLTLPRSLTLLDRLQALGFQGVVVQICYPLLDPTYPRSSEYLQFYKGIVAAVHQHGMKVLVESGAMFANTAYSPTRIDWSRYTADSFLQGRENQVLLIASQIKPDYLMIGNEPTTEEMLTGLKISPAQWGGFLQDTLAKIDRSGGTLVGAGAGTWEDPAYFNQVMQTPGFDFIDLHIYPMGRNATLLARALSEAQEARAAGKRVTVSEAWLYKAAPQEGSTAYGNYAQIYNRDVYSFWEPLDARFIQDLVRLADATHMDFLSFFWGRYFFAYLDYDTTPHDQSSEAFNSQINQASLAGVENGSLSSLGQWLQGFLHMRLGP